TTSAPNARTSSLAGARSGDRRKARDVQRHSDGAGGSVERELRAEAPEYCEHRLVVGKDQRGEAPHAALAGDPGEDAQQQRPDATSLEGVAHDDAELGRARIVGPAGATDGTAGAIARPPG